MRLARQANIGCTVWEGKQWVGIRLCVAGYVGGAV